MVSCFIAWWVVQVSGDALARGCPPQHVQYRSGVGATTPSAGLTSQGSDLASVRAVV